MGAEQTSSVESETPTTDTTSEMDTTTTGTDETPETASTTETDTEEQPQSSSSDDLSKELESLRAALKKANAEAAKHRKEAKELASYKEQIESEKLSESEKLQKKYADLQKAHDETIRQAQEYKINTEIRLQAAQQDFAKPSDAIKLLEWAEIEYDDNGNPTNVAELLANLLKAEPHLRKQSSKPAPTAGGATNPSRSARVSDDASEYINKLRSGQMTTAEYEALPASTKQKIQTLMLSGRRR